MLFNVVLTDDTDKTATIVDGLNSIRDSVSTGGTNMYMLGEPTSTDDFKKISEEDLQKGETMGVARRDHRSDRRVRGRCSPA